MTYYDSAQFQDTTKEKFPMHSLYERQEQSYYASFHTTYPLNVRRGHAVLTATSHIKSLCVKVTAPMAGGKYASEM